MPRYFFVIKFTAEQHDDPFGTSFPTDAEAHQYALRVVQELKAAGGYDEPGLTIIVKNEHGETVFTMPFAGSLN